MDGRREQRRVFLTVTALIAGDSALFTLVIPALPIFADRYGLSDAATVLIFGVFPLAQLSTTIPLTGLLDRVGRRPTMVAGALALLVSTAGFALADSVPLLVLTRAIQGSAAAMVWTAGIAAISDVYPQDQLGFRLGLAETVGGGIGLIGPVAGGALIEWVGTDEAFAIATIVPLVLILKEPDLGTSLTLAGVLFPVLYWSGVSVLTLFFLVSPLFAVLASLHLLAFVLYLAGLFALLAYGRERNLVVLLVVLVANLAAGIARPVLWGHLKPYQQGRILSFISPNDTLGSAYQIIQSKVAIGSGGIAGKGYLQGTQKGLSFLPEQHTDFIFSVFAEEWGFVGVLVLLVLFVGLIWLSLEIASKAKDQLGALLAVGIVAMLCFCVVVNIGMTAGMFPIVGIPLPLVSYGGSATIMTMASLGLLLNVKRKRLSLFY